MKNLTKMTLAAGFATMFTVVANATADGIAASPKVQQMLNERAARAAVSGPVSSITYRTPGSSGITASPKVTEMLADRKVVVSSTGTEVVTSGYNPTGSDGVTASPKLRSQLNERNAPIVIAPLK